MGIFHSKPLVYWKVDWIIRETTLNSVTTTLLTYQLNLLAFLGEPNACTVPICCL
jgi:hypothetical protein